MPCAQQAKGDSSSFCTISVRRFPVPLLEEMQRRGELGGLSFMLWINEKLIDKGNCPG